MPVPGTQVPCQPRVLLLDHALVQLFEERRRLPQRVPRRQFTLRPGSNGAGVLLGQRLVGGGLLLVLDHVLRPRELPVVALVAVQQPPKRKGV